MEIKLSKASVKALREMDSSMRAHILSGIDGLIKLPPEGDIKPLAGYNTLWRLRVGKYRVIYHYEDNVLIVDSVGSRGDIYK